MTQQRPVVYTASRMLHASLWLAQRQANFDIEFSARWIDQTKSFDDAAFSDEVKRQGWIQDEEDIRRAEYLVCYGQPKETLRGALVEAGMAMALGKKILCVGGSHSFGTWCKHPTIWQYTDSLESAWTCIRQRHYHGASIKALC